jgi:hypothetical protein
MDECNMHQRKVTESTISVQDIIETMNKVDGRGSIMEEPLSMDEKSYPKRASVVDLWRKREGSIKSSNAKSTYNFEEKKGSYGDEEEQEQDSDRDSRQQEKRSGWSDPRTVTPERSCPDTNAVSVVEDRESEVGSSVSAGGGSARRSNVRESWKKRASNIPSQPSHTAPRSAFTATNNDVSAASVSPPILSKFQVTPERKDCLIANPDALEAKLGSTPAGNDQVFFGPPAAVTQTQNPDLVSRENAPGTSSSAFDELRSKWAKFGVQKVQARDFTHKQVSQSGVTSPKPINPPTIPRDAPYASALSKNSQANLFRGDEIQASIPGNEENPQKPEEKAFSTPENTGEVGKPHDSRKNHLVKLGQLHTSRPKADSPNRHLSQDESQNAEKNGSKTSMVESKAATGSQVTSNSPGTTDSATVIQKRNTFRRSTDTKALLRAKQRRRGYPTVPKENPVKTNLNSTYEPSVELSLGDPFPLDEMYPEAFDKTNNTQKSSPSNDMIRSSLPMQTLLGSKSGLSDKETPLWESRPSDFDSFPLPYANSNFTAMTQQVKKTEVNVMAIDSWSDMESFSKEDQTSHSNRSQVSSTSLTSSAIKRIRDKRQKNNSFAGVVPGDTDKQENSFSAAKTQSMNRRAPLDPEPTIDHNGRNVAQNASPGLQENGSYVNPSVVSMDDSVARNPSLCSETLYSSSKLESPNTSSKKYHHRSALDVVVDANEMVPDEFVSEKDANVQSFQTAYNNMSLEQIAKDMQEEASSVLNMDFLNNDFLNNDLLNQGMQAAGQSLNKLVSASIGGGVFQQKRSPKKLIKRPTSPIEEVAIEVEYIADAED